MNVFSLRSGIQFGLLIFFVEPVAASENSNVVDDDSKIFLFIKCSCIYILTERGSVPMEWD